MKKIIFLVLSFSFLFSLGFVLGRVDQDYFSFYYVGKGVAEGGMMYGDFVDNKGPVLYWFFAFLHLVFSGNYLVALVAASTLVDAAAIIFLLLFAKDRFKLVLPARFLESFILSLFLVSFYKSFSLGMFMGGFYAESLGVMWVSACFYALGKKKFFVAGVLFCLAVLSRQTLVFWGIWFVYELLRVRGSLYKNAMRASTGALLALAAIALALFIKGDLWEFWRAITGLSLAYVGHVTGHYWLQLKAVVMTEARIAASLVFFVVMTVLLYIQKGAKETQGFLVAFVSGLLASFVGGLFYFHHFMQFTPAFLTVFLCVFSLEIKFARFIMACMALFLLSNYLYFFSSTRQFTTADAEFVCQAANGRNIQVVPYYPELYATTGLTSPDRYYQSFRLSSFYNRDPEPHWDEHIRLLEPKIKNTSFVVVEANAFDSEIAGEYLQRLKSAFSLELASRVSRGAQTISIYEQVD